MILSRDAIQKEIADGNIKLNPSVSDDDYSPSSVDIHLGNEITVFKLGNWSLFGLGKKKKTKVTSWNKGWTKDKADNYTKMLKKRGYKKIKVTYDNRLGGYIHKYESK